MVAHHPTYLRDGQIRARNIALRLQYYGQIEMATRNGTR
jgi:hypothetical protein